jgi:16S rRNA (cytosine967-C5)-methyltransferase
MDPRTAAVRALTQVFSQGCSLGAALSRFLPEVAEPRDRALAQDLCFGVLRWGPRLEAVAAQLLHRPLPGRDADVHCLILVGLYQMIHTRVPVHAAVAETVAAADRLDKPWARGLVNALLRRFQREGEALLARVDRDEAVALAHPAWMLAAFRRDWPEDWRAIAAADNEHPPMCLRVNRLRGTRAACLDDFARRGLAAEAVPGVDSAVLLEHPVDVRALPGFAEGRLSVQDAAAQLAAALIDVQPGQQVLDLCAAPGGKTAHILETEPRLARLVAVDRDAERMGRVSENLGRLGLAAELVCADAGAPDGWWDGAPFDRILLDAPCSATGVIRRHPDIKRLRRAEDIPALAREQRRLLDSAWPLLAPGGMLLYATCSIMHLENDRQIEDFLARHDDARERPIAAGWGRPLTRGRQILQGEGRMDGFFYACVEKAPRAPAQAA